MISHAQLVEWAANAAAGDRAVATSMLAAIQDDVYRLSLRMLGHPADAEDTTQRILLIVLTQCGDSRGECAFRTWVCRIAANELTELFRVGEVLRQAPSYQAPNTFGQHIRELVNPADSSCCVIPSHQQPNKPHHADVRR
jgi:DNA-directed RNA polymerase specialized sigma24 family protein